MLLIQWQKTLLAAAQIKPNSRYTVYIQYKHKIKILCQNIHSSYLNLVAMKFSLGVAILCLLLINHVRGSFIYGQPCTEKNTAYLQVGTWRIPENRTYCVDVTGFKKNMHSRINLSKYKEFFDAVQLADTLYSDQCNLTRFPIVIVKSLPNVELVDLSINVIHKLPTKLDKYAPNIKKLLLSDNRVFVPRRGPLLSSKTLETLSLSNNQINKVYKSTFKKLPNLQVLYLDNNNLQTLEPIFGTVQNLQFLHVGRNYLTSLPPKEEISHSLKRYITKSQKELRQ
uniref:Leucine-rich repeat-containing protein 57-like n=1 Tax=Diabrotica virgifera virgifera TaxID=50390 RepID=A0A6P7G3P7_DIAVI